MATITHVTAGEVAKAAHQNGLIDQVNTNTTSVADYESRLSTVEGRTFAPAAVTLVQSSTQTIPTGEDTAIGNWMVFGTMAGNGLWTTGDDFVTIPETGEYSITETLVFAANGTNGSTLGQRVVYVNIDNYAPAGDGSNVLSSSLYGPSDSYVGGTSDGGVPIPVSWGGTLDAGTRVYMTCWQDSGGPIDTRTGFAGQTILSVVRMS